MDQLPARLDDLIEYVKTRMPDGGPLEHLSTAVVAGEQLGELADHLIGHFVDQARRAGASWTEIGQSMGVSKQAAQKRFVPKDSGGFEIPAGDLFGRFTRRAKRAVVNAQEAARNAKHDYVGTEHIVLGLLTEPEGLAAEAIEAQGTTLDAVREAVGALLGPPKDKAVAGHLPFTRRSKKVLELAVREALKLGHNYIGTEHILLGVLGDDDALGAKALIGLGITKDTTLEWLIPVLTKMAADKGRGAT
jgi:Clp amino terminal domain, pathogenicity island component